MKTFLFIFSIFLTAVSVFAVGPNGFAGKYEVVKYGFIGGETLFDTTNVVLEFVESDSIEGCYHFAVPSTFDTCSITFFNDTMFRINPHNSDCFDSSCYYQVYFGPVYPREPENDTDTVLNGFFRNDSISFSYILGGRSGVFKFTCLGVKMKDTRTLNVGYSQSTVFPNPTINLLHLRNVSTKIRDYQIFSLSGTLQSSGQIVNNRVDVSILPNGVYILKTREENGTLQHHKFVKKGN